MKFKDFMAVENAPAQNTRMKFSDFMAEGNAPASVPVPDAIDNFTGGKERLPASNWIARGVYQTGKDLATIPYRAVNTAFLGYPKDKLVTGGAVEFPQAESRAGKAAGVLADMAGFVGSPVVKGAAAVAKIPQVAKVLSKIPNIVKASGAGAAFGGAYAPEEGQSRVGNAAVAAAVPVAFKGAEKLAQGASAALKDAPGRVINSLIKPLLKDFSFGKNPGARVAKEGIVGNNWDDMVSKISTRSDEVGGAIEDTLYPESVQKIDLTKVIRPLIVAKNTAMFSPKRNKNVISQLDDLISDLSNVHDENGKIIGIRDLKDLTPLEAWEFKKKVGDLPKWTDNPTDDKIVNKALKQIYGDIKDKINHAVPAVKELNERYADLITAKTAAIYRDKIVARQNLIKFAPKLLGGGSALVGLASGNPVAVIAGIGAMGVDSLLASTAFKTRLANGLSKMSEVDKAKVFQAYPKVKQWLINEVNRPYLSPRETPSIKGRPVEIMPRETAAKALGLPDQTGRGVIPAPRVEPFPPKPGLPTPQGKLPAPPPNTTQGLPDRSGANFRMVGGSPVASPQQLPRAGYPNPSEKLPPMRSGEINPPSQPDAGYPARDILKESWLRKKETPVSQRVFGDAASISTPAYRVLGKVRKLESVEKKISAVERMKKNGEIGSKVYNEVMGNIKKTLGSDKGAMSFNPLKSSESVYHETGNMDIINAISDATGLNVATNESLALGQSGKGILFEIDKTKMLGSRGSLRPIKKPGTSFVGQHEFEVVGGEITPDAIKSIIIKKGARLSDIDIRKINAQIKSGKFSKESLSNGDIKLIRKIGTNPNGNPRRKSLKAEQ